MSPIELKVYLYDNYGTCQLGGKCLCQDRRLDCKNWKPAGAKTWEELRVWQERNSQSER